MCGPLMLYSCKFLPLPLPLPTGERPHVFNEPYHVASWKRAAGVSVIGLCMRSHT